MNILILEDNLEQSKLLEKIVKDTFDKATIRSSKNISEAQEHMQQCTFDLFILDIILNPSDASQDNGIHFATSIRNQEQYSHTPIIFITSYPEHMQAAINDTHCYSFIIKPYNTDTVVKTLIEVSDYYDSETAFLKIKDYTGIIFKLRISDILYIESNGHRITFYTEYSNYDSGEFTLEKTQNMLPDIFIRCHKKYIININKVSIYDKTNRFIRIGENTIPVGRAHKNTFEERWIK